MRSALAVSLVVVLCAATGCQSPTAASSTFNVDNFVDGSSSPNPVSADPSTDGRTYRVVRGNNQPDDVLTYQYVTSFTVTLSFNGNATNSSNNIKFPVTITSASTKVQQASGGIVSTPASGDTEHYDAVILGSSTSTISQVGAGATLTVKAWYSLPSNGKEALITESIAMKDSSSTPLSFTKDIQVRVSP
jgi:hypothetical protein